MKVKLAELKDKMTKDKEAAINLEIKRALEDAAKQAKAATNEAGEEASAAAPKEEK